MTNLALAVVIATVVVGVLVVFVRHLTVRSTPSVDLNNITVSRQWLIQHQSNERS